MLSDYHNARNNKDVIVIQDFSDSYSLRTTYSHFKCYKLGILAVKPDIERLKALDIVCEKSIFRRSINKMKECLCNFDFQLRYISIKLRDISIIRYGDI